jgi:hypothetical protein
VFVPDWLLRPPVFLPGFTMETPTAVLMDPHNASPEALNKSTDESSPRTDSVDGRETRTRGKPAVNSSQPSGRTKGREVALESAVHTVVAAREAALREKIESEVTSRQLLSINWFRLMFLVQAKLDESIRLLALMELQPLSVKSVAGETTRIHSRIPRSRFLGEDRYGREYWLLGVQESAPLVPLGRTLSNTMSTADPAVLVKEPSGWWGFHNGRYLDTLVNSFTNTIPCEKMLRISMSERLNFARRKLYSTTLRFKQSQHEWLTTIVRGEVNISNFKLATGSGKEVAKSLELLWTRCLEVRGHAHYSELHRIEDHFVSTATDTVRAQREAQLRRLKRLKDYTLPVSFDLHPTQGWFHVSPATHIKDIYCSTIATRILADPTIYRPFQDCMKRSQYRQQQIVALEKHLNPVGVAGLLADGDDADGRDGMESPRDGEDMEEREMEIEQQQQQQQYAAELEGETRQQMDNRNFNRGLRPVEQLHIVTHEVLRIHRTGRDAAKFLNVSQSGISLCLTGAKPDAYGFKWRYYVGPRIDCKLSILCMSMALV